MFSILLTAFAYFEWQTTKSTFKAEMESSIARQIEVLETSIQGRASAVIGLIIGTLHSDPTRFVQNSANIAYIEDALTHCTDAYEKLSRISGTKREMALNNLVFFTLLSGRISNRRDLLAKARILRNAGEQSSAGRDAATYLLTYCRAILQLGDSDREREEAKQIVAELLHGKDLSSLQQREALFYWDAFSNRAGSAVPPRPAP